MLKKKIVLIEDNEDVRETTKEILELADYSVLTVGDGKKGVEVVKAEKPDLVICDIAMPELDGYGVLSILNKNPETYNIPFIFLTAKIDRSDIRKGMNHGADDYITKPFRETELLEAIETRINRSEHLKTELKSDINEDITNEIGHVEELKALTKDRKVLTFKKKETIYREFDYANYLYYIIKGRVKCVKTDTYGKDFLNDLYGPGDFIGYISLLEEKEQNETAITMDLVQVALIPKNDFLSLVKKNHSVSNKLIKYLSGQVRNKEDRLLQMAYSPVIERVADILINLQKRVNKGQDENQNLEISREDLASFVGTSKESLIRTLSELKKEGLIETDGQQIKILNEAALRRISKGV